MLLFISCVLCAGAGALEVTGAAAAGGGPAAGAKTLTLSGALEIGGVSLKAGAVVMPVTEYKGRTYSDVKLLSKDLYARIDACLSKGACAGRPPFAEPEVKLDGLKALNSKTRVANADVVFDGELLVTAGVMKSSGEPGEIWISWPAVIKFKAPALKARAEELVKARYAKVPGKSQKGK